METQIFSLLLLVFDSKWKIWGKRHGALFVCIARALRLNRIFLASGILLSSTIPHFFVANKNSPKMIWIVRSPPHIVTDAQICLTSAFWICMLSLISRREWQIRFDCRNEIDYLIVFFLLICLLLHEDIIAQWGRHQADVQKPYHFQSLNRFQLNMISVKFRRYFIKIKTLVFHAKL